MTIFLKTLIGAVVLLLLACVCLGIGWLISGKNRLRKRCGMRPRDDASSTTCPLCGGGEPCEDDSDDDHDDSSTDAKRGP